MSSFSCFCLPNNVPDSKANCLLTEQNTKLTSELHLYTTGCLCAVGNNWHRHWQLIKVTDCAVIKETPVSSPSHWGSWSWGVGKPRTEQCPLDMTGPLNSWTPSWSCLHKPCIKSSQSTFQHEGAGSGASTTAMSYWQLFLDKGESLFFNNAALVDQSCSNGWSHTHECVAAQTGRVSLKETTNEDLKLGGKVNVLS